MRRLVVLLTLFALVTTLLTPGCVFMNVQRPHDKNYDKTELGAKVGRSQVDNLLVGRIHIHQ